MAMEMFRWCGTDGIREWKILDGYQALYRGHRDRLCIPGRLL